MVTTDQVSGAAAHLTGTVSAFPSIFELVSAQAFSSALYSALRHLAQYTGASYPEKLGFLVQWYDELYLLLDAVLQAEYLKTRRATLGEAFYGLQRIPKDGTLISVLPSWILVVVAPYLRRKISSWHETIKMKSAVSQNEAKLLHWIPRIKATLKAIELYKYVRYSLGLTATHDYSLDILGIHLGHTTISSSAERNLSGKPLKKLLVTAADTILWMIEIGSFFVQFLEAYSKRDYSASSAELVPEFYKSSLKLDDTKCPICQEPRRNPAALATSGFSFCYSCISKYLAQYKKCPVTDIPSNFGHIVRIFNT